MLSLGATVLKVGISKLLDTSPSPVTVTSVNKIGEAAPSTQQLQQQQQQQQVFKNDIHK